MNKNPIFRRRANNFLFMARSFQLVFLMLSLCGLPTAAHATGLGDFAGHWRGESIDSSDGLKVSKEDLSLKFSPIDGGFELEWKAPGGDVEKAGFVESEDKPGIFSARASSGGLLGFFSSSEEVNPLDGDPLVWARLAGDVLIVYKLVIDEQGAFTLDRYENTLQSDTLRLRFSRRSHGKPEQSLDAHLKLARG